MIDVHCHLNFQAFDKDRNEVIKKASDSGVTKIINVGAMLDSSKKAVQLAIEHKNLFATIGIHPHHSDKLFLCHPEQSEGSHFTRDFSASPQNDTFWFDELEELAQNPKVVAIGECGMDFYKYESNGIADQKSQEELFIKHIKLSSKLKLPLMIHNRQAGKEILDILLNHKSLLLNKPGMFHCMSGNIELLRKVLELGFYVGFDGNITYKGLAKGEDTDLKDLVKFTPIDRILTETDAPYLTPEPHRGSRNTPEYVILIARSIAEIKGISFEKVEGQTVQNADELFQLS